MILKCVTYQLINGFYSGRLSMQVSKFSHHRNYLAFFHLNSAALMFLKYNIFVVQTYPCSSCTYVSVCCVILVDHHALVVFLALLSFYDSLGAEQSNDNNCKVLSFDISLNKTLWTFLGPTFILSMFFHQTFVLPMFVSSKIHFVR